MKKNKKPINIIAIILIVLLVVAAAVAVSFYRDKQKFANVSVDINKIAETIVGNGQLNKQEYCMYNELKYSKGQLSCVTGISLATDTALPDQSKLDEITSNQKWVSEGSNLGSWTGVDKNYIYAHIYSKNDLTCSIREKRTEKNSLIEIDCSGPAKAEWFPVKTN